jgi:hypothetical protein
VAAAHPDAEELIETETAVHVVLRVAQDFAAEGEAAVAEVQRKLAALRQHIASPAFRARHGDRVAVLRLRTPTTPPSIVVHLLQEEGVELEAEDRPRAAPGERCALCGRTGLWEDQVSMTEEGWACPSCFRAWGLRQQRGGARGEPMAGARRVSSTVRTVGLLLFLLGCFILALWTLDGMHRANRLIRFHLPTGQ